MCTTTTTHTETNVPETPPRHIAGHRVTKIDKQRHPLIVAARRLETCYAKLDRNQLRSRCESLQGRAGEYIDRYLRTERQLHRAIRLNYHHAAKALSQRCSRSLRDLEHFIRCHQHTFQRPLPSPPTLKSIHQELLAVEDEFGEIEFDARENVLSVTTDPIVLEGLDLGRFRIELQIWSMTHEGTADWHRIEALDPNPAASDEDVTHPHVQSGKLCSGDAFESIHNTLINGRLSEFFLIVRSVLETYNSHSPYVSIEGWHGRSCYDCDNLVSSDDYRYCESCQRDYCDDCASWCRGCDQSFCLNCMRDSEISPHMYCDDCYGICSRCERVGGRIEFTDKLCPACIAMLEEEEENEQPDEDPSTTTSNQELPTHDHQSSDDSTPEADDANGSVQASGLTSTHTQRCERDQAVQPPLAAEQIGSTAIDQTTEEDEAETPDDVLLQTNRPAGAEVLSTSLAQTPAALPCR